VCGVTDHVTAGAPVVAGYYRYEDHVDGQRYLAAKVENTATARHEAGSSMDVEE